MVTNGLNSASRLNRCAEIPRTRLLKNILPRFQPGNLLLITAGPGMGKTCLVHQLLERCEGKTAFVDFRKLSTDINALVRWLEGVFTELWPDFFSNLPPRHPAPVADQASLEANIDFLLDELILCGDTPAVIVFDGCEVLASRPLWAELISRLLQRFPSFVSIILLSTVPLKFSPFSRLRIQGQLLELSTEDLYFDQAEIHEYFAANAPALSDQGQNYAMSKVGGWPAGLSLLCFEMQQGGHDTFTDEDYPESLIDYLQYEVLSGISPDDLKILMSAALLQPFTLDLLKKLLAVSGQRLADIFSEFSFLLDDKNLSVPTRFSNMFAQYLVVRSKEVLGKQAIQKLHKRAVKFFKKQQDIDRSLTHLVALENWPATVKLILSGNRKWTQLEDYGRLLHWGDQLPVSVLLQQPVIIVLLGKAHLYLGNLDAAWKSFSMAFEKTRVGCCNKTETGN